MFHYKVDKGHVNVTLCLYQLAYCKIGFILHSLSHTVPKPMNVINGGFLVHLFV